MNNRLLSFQEKPSILFHKHFDKFQIYQNNVKIYHIVKNNNNKKQQSQNQTKHNQDQLTNKNNLETIQTLSKNYQNRLKSTPNMNESPYKSKLNRRLFSRQQHQTHLLSQRELQIKQFEMLIASKNNIQTITYEDGSIYRGELLDNVIRQGIGMMVSPDNCVYIGKWNNNIYHEQGIYLFADGQRYEGEIQDGRKCGHGKMYYANGDIYEGEWLDDCRQGTGQIIYGGIDGRYVGQWRDNMCNGQGIYYSGIKTVAKGTWHDNLFISGTVQLEEYSGQWNNNGPHGEGTYRFADNSVYTGQFTYSEKQGNGVYYYANGDVYEGEFRNGLKHGKGVYKYSSGDKYEGQFYHDLKWGYGVMKFVNQDEYRGNWEKDLFHGSGTYTFNGKQTIKAKFVYGKPQPTQSIVPSSSSLAQQQSPIANFNSPQKSPFSKLEKQGYAYSPIRTQKQYSKLLLSPQMMALPNSSINYVGGNSNSNINNMGVIGSMLSGNKSTIPNGGIIGIGNNMGRPASNGSKNNQNYKK